MEKNTSFIPKSPVEQQKRAAPKKGGASLAYLFSLTIFLVALVSAVGVYVYKVILEKDIQEKEISLENARRSFEPATIAELKRMDTKLILAERLLQRHTALTPLFAVLEDFTLGSIQFTSFLYRREGSSAFIEMDGIAPGFPSLAFQSVILAGNKLIVNPLFAELHVDEDAVTYKLSAQIDPMLTSYKENILAPASSPADETPFVPTPQNPIESDDETGSVPDISDTPDTGEQNEPSTGGVPLPPPPKAPPSL
ncbi:hypothetical protein L0Y49_04095 [bacterium]|nr:hypothetical protein [bacterium]MCI0565654.1 hypothetical protein [bacterium]MCI0679952.1 hypothetical protein [bacterium]